MQENPYKKRCNFKLVMDILILIVFPLPFYDRYIFIKQNDENGLEYFYTDYLLSDFMIAFMFLRILFLLRSAVNYSIYKDAYSIRLCQSYGFNGGTRFFLKCLFKQYPLLIVVSLFTLSIVVLSYLVRIFELPYMRNAFDKESKSLD